MSRHQHRWHLAGQRDANFGPYIDYCFDNHWRFLFKRDKLRAEASQKFPRRMMATFICDCGLMKEIEVKLT